MKKKHIGKEECSQMDLVLYKYFEMYGDENMLLDILEKYNKKSGGFSKKFKRKINRHFRKKINASRAPFPEVDNIIERARSRNWCKVIGRRNNRGR